MNIEIVYNSKQCDVCPLCGSSLIYKVGIIPIIKPTLYSSTEIKLKNDYEYWECNSCFSGFSQNIVCEDDSKKLYINNKSNKWQSEKIEVNKTKELINEIKKYFFDNLQVLDIGSNTGELLDYCKQNGLDTYGVEYSIIGKEITRQKGHTVYDSVDSIEKGKKFDLIFAFDLIEHLYDVNNFFDKITRILKKNGKIILLTGNPNCVSAKLSKSKWWYLRYPEHIVFPSKKYLSNILGLRLVSYIKVYNSIGYKRMSVFYLSFRMVERFMRFILSLVLNRYTGLFSMDKDHHLVVLCKN